MEIIMEPFIVGDCGTVYKKSLSVNIYDVYLTESIESSGDYREIAHTFTLAGERDEVRLHLANYGGSCHGCVNLVNSIRGCKAPVRCIVTAPCYSAGATLALCGTSLEMKKNTFLMFHNYSSFTGGKGGELVLSIEETNKWIHKYFRDVHMPFLTTAEAKSIEFDQDVYIHSHDKTLKKRMERHFKHNITKSKK